MESALDNFAKLLERLTTRMENVEQELRKTREWETTNNVSENGPRVGPHHPRNNDQNDFAGVNCKNIKLEAPTFDGQLDPQIFLFLDWISDMNHYFDWYEMSDERRVRVAKMKLMGQASQYWTNVEKLMWLRHQKAIQTWDEMKLKLQEKHLPVSYKRLLD